MAKKVKLPDIFVEALVDTLVKGQGLYGGSVDECREAVMKNPAAYLMSFLLVAKRDGANREWSVPTNSTIGDVDDEDMLAEAEKILKEGKIS
jgi:hypothetical protein